MYIHIEKLLTKHKYFYYFLYFLTNCIGISATICHTYTLTIILQQKKKRQKQVNLLRVYAYMFV